MRNETLYYGSIDPLNFYLQIPYKDFAPLKEQWLLIPGIKCTESEAYGI